MTCRLAPALLAALPLAAAPLAVSAETLCVALILPGSITDGTFNSAAHQGILMAQENHDIEVSIRENTDFAQITEVVTSYARDGFDVVIGHGFQFAEPILEIQADFPDTWFIVNDDGRFLRVSLDGAVEEIASFGSRWVDHVAASRPGGWRACSSGRVVHLWGERPDRAEALEHPSTVGGLAFDPKGRRLAVAHYGGVTVWEKAKRGWRPQRLAWVGSHVGVTWSPDGRVVVSAMQEAALHGWRLRDKAEMAMSGYPAKVRSMAWAGATPFLVTSGADQAVAWPFDGKGGPMGRAPLCVAHGGGPLVTFVLALPGLEVVMAGFQDGAVLFGALTEDDADRVVRGSTDSEVTSMALTGDGMGLLIGDAAGRLLWASPREGLG